MDKNTASRYHAVLELAQADPLYAKLTQELLRCDRAMLALFQRLPPEDTDLLMDYLGVCSEMERLRLEIACREL